MVRHAALDRNLARDILSVSGAADVAEDHLVDLLSDQAGFGEDGFHHRHTQINC